MFILKIILAWIIPLLHKDLESLVAKPLAQLNFFFNLVLEVG